MPASCAASARDRVPLRRAERERERQRAPAAAAAVHRKDAARRRRDVTVNRRCDAAGSPTSAGSDEIGADAGVESGGGAFHGGGGRITSDVRRPDGAKTGRIRPTTVRIWRIQRQIWKPDEQ